MKKIFVIILIITSFGFTKNIHKYYLSLTEIEIISEKKIIQIITNVFIDDFEIAINRSFDINASISEKNEIKNLDDYIYKYLKSHLKLKTNDKILNFKLIGKEIEGDLIYFYLEIENAYVTDTINIENTILITDFIDQQNLTKIKKGKKRKSFIFNRKTTTKTLILN